jgi:putative MATE family efflux protein
MIEQKLKMTPRPDTAAAIRGPSLFSNKDLLRLFLPLVVEQFLEYLVGLADSIMISHVGEAAVSGVSLVDFVIALLISLFTALSTGGAVVAGQYLGKKRREEAGEAANQLVWFAGLASVVIMIAMYLARKVILKGLFGEISDDVYGNANSYFLIVTASIPFLALYNGGAAIFRSMGNSRLPMNIMLAMNFVHVALNVVFLYVFRFGTAGVATSTLISRIGAAIIIITLVLNEKYELHLRKTLRHRFNWGMIGMILGIGVPYGFENGMFYLGRLLILSLVATFGTAAIAANFVSGTLTLFQVLPGMSIGLGLTVVISRCVGSGDFAQARYFTKKILAIIYVVQVASAAAVLALLTPILKVYGLSTEATALIRQLVWYHATAMVVIWPLAYTLPVTFRASGDARFPMVVSILTMGVFRIALSYVFSLYFGMGVVGTWVAMFVDWIAKAVVFVFHYLGGKWTSFRAIREN